MSLRRNQALQKRELEIMGSVTKSFVWSFLEQAGSRVSAMVIEIIMARILAPEVFGVMALLLVLINVADVLAQSGLGTALIQRQDVTDLSYSTGFWLSIFLALILYALIWLIAPIISAFYSMEELDLFLRVTALALFPKAYNSIQRSYLQKNMEFKALFVANTTAVLVSGVSGVILAVLGFGIWALIAQNILQAVVACAVMLIMIPWHPTFAFSKRKAGELFGYGWKICVSGIFGKLYTGLSELIIGKTCGATPLGYYSNGSKWPNAGMGAFSNAIENVLFPAFSKISSNVRAFCESVERSIVVGTYIMAFISLLLIATAEPLIIILLTDKWLPSVPVFQLTCLSSAVCMLQVVVLRAYMALGDSGLYMKLQMIKVVLGALVISAVAFLTADIYMVALTVTLVAFFNILVIDLQPAKVKLGLTRWHAIKLVAPCLGLGVLCAAIAYGISFLNLPTALTLGLEIVVYSLLYISVSRFFGLRGFKECLAALQSLRNR